MTEDVPASGREVGALVQGISRSQAPSGGRGLLATGILVFSEQFASIPALVMRESAARIQGSRAGLILLCRQGSNSSAEFINLIDFTARN